MPKLKTTKVFENLLKPEVIGAKPSFWGQETKIFNQIKKKYPDLNFWSWFCLDFKLNSLAFFLTKEGKIMLQQKYKFFENNKNLIAKSEPVVYDLEVEPSNQPPKIKSLMDFV